VWGKAGWGGTGAPDDSGYIKIYSTHKGFAAIKADGSIKAWGVSGRT
jgi:diketogulonate reductase-like aldo/keto reductase